MNMAVIRQFPAVSLENLYAAKGRDYFFGANLAAPLNRPEIDKTTGYTGET
jgi:hypothetical protein